MWHHHGQGVSPSLIPLLTIESGLRILKCTDVKLADFGLCEHVDISCSGTVSFSSPELLMGYSIRYSDDIWAFGCTMLQLTFHLSPFAVPETVCEEDEPVIRLRLMEIFSGALVDRPFTDCTVIDVDRDTLDSFDPIIGVERSFAIEVCTVVIALTDRIEFGFGIIFFADVSLGHDVEEDICTQGLRSTHRENGFGRTILRLE
jgi:Protein kinase domain